ncbi:nucleotidyl transferase AbiEii/AbiGii toxin family protein [Methylovirgula sp. 4M-Z18]|uniref:nucleotidyl transferase AbiEii/AbiGii toxin family protein n=1 Tax=Methylovirgula sp. 4M-Z18 TaxID=2293567 RepID=UPI000E2EA3DC|nr:nucleotidyl transferase AbiEii/AbiGii toxin family protein [Methylovirgula sp. 4M-Z18]RFB76603.1 nucleotidyl transferase AbiEii/AbiGii toxin family protein [Methylovirgula sp. 4M-Z18]
MPPEYLHNHPQFADLLRIVAQEKSIDPALVEKDYWIMHCLYGLQKLGMKFELKGGTSLSKGFHIIDRFSEDIDIRIEPPADRDVKTKRNQTKPAHIKSRQDFYDWLAQTIRIEGIVEVKRDTAFDNATFFSGGIRLFYKSSNKPVVGLKDGILLEVGFDDVTPNIATDISSWAYDDAVRKVDIIDNRPKAVACYDPGYTLVEKLQTISTKFRKQQESGEFPSNFMRHYYDVYSLLKRPEVQAFIGTNAYGVHKAKRFRTADNPDITANQAFILHDLPTRETYKTAYAQTSALYYKTKPTFEQILAEIGRWAARL